MTQPQTGNSYRIDRREGQQGSHAGVTVLAQDFDKFVTERNRTQLLKCKRTINLSTLLYHATVQPTLQMNRKS